MQCFPLYSILLALNQLTVDFFSLDIEGDELRVLQTIPFDKVRVQLNCYTFAKAAVLQNILKKSLVTHISKYLFKYI